MHKVDILIAGAGIIGLNVARYLLKEDPKLKVWVVDKENQVGFHASTRNSGVLHSGCYYSSGSMKSRFCIQGNKEWHDLLQEHSLPHRKIGKLIVAKNDNEVDRLVQLYENGRSQGVELELIESNKLDVFDPLAKSHKMFIWSPSTTISDPKTIMNFIAADVRTLGGKILTNSLVRVLPGRRILINDERISYRHFVNCAGSYADVLAHQFDTGKEYSLVPFKGSYYEADSSDLPISKLIYPLPHQTNAFLGVHITPTLGGKVKLGPTASPVLGPEFYNWNFDLTWQDFRHSFRGHTILAKSNVRDFANIAISELRKQNLKYLLSQAQHLVKVDLKKLAWKKTVPGIRAQLVNTVTGKLESDFRVITTNKSTHLLNVVSPGWTSALTFSREIAEKVIQDLKSN